MKPTETAQTLIVQALIAEADALAAAGRLEDSVRVLEDALRRSPDLADSWYNLGLRRRHLGRAEAALDAYGEALTAPSNPAAPFQRRSAFSRFSTLPILLPAAAVAAAKRSTYPAKSPGPCR